MCVRLRNTENGGDVATTLNDFQRAARKTAIYPTGYAVVYPALGLAGEAGEAANKTKKWVRGDDKDDANLHPLTDERIQQIKAEIGGALWYAANLAHDIDTDLETIAQENLTELADRAERGKLQGDGDKR